MKVLGIETSCDETGVALYDTERGLLADALYSQIDIHAEPSQQGNGKRQVHQRGAARPECNAIEHVGTEPGAGPDGSSEAAKQGEDESADQEYVDSGGRG